MSSTLPTNNCDTNYHTGSRVGDIHLADTLEQRMLDNAGAVTLPPGVANEIKADEKTRPAFGQSYGPSQGP